MREPARFSWKHWWNAVMVLLVATDAVLWGMNLLDGRLAAALPVAWILAGFVATPAIIYEHTGFLDRHVFHDYSKARSRYRRAVDTGKATPDGLAALGSLCYSEGDLGEAARLLEEALSKRPEDPHIHALFARVLTRLGRHAEAVEAAAGLRSVRGPELDPLSELTLGRVLKAQGEAVAAASAYQKVIETGRDIVEPRIALTEIYLGMGKSDDARRESEEALRISPSDPEALYWAGKAAEASGNHEEAGKFYRSALESSSIGERAYSVSYKDMVKAVSMADEASAPSEGVPSLGQDVRKA